MIGKKIVQAKYPHGMWEFFAWRPLLTSPAFFYIEIPACERISLQYLRLR